MDAPAIAGLTPRQTEIALLAARDVSNKEIARRLVLSPATVHTHLAAAFRVLGVRNRHCLLILALSRGWLDLAELCCEVEARFATNEVANGHHP